MTMAQSTYELDVICLRNGLNDDLIYKECNGNNHLFEMVVNRLKVLKDNEHIVKQLLNIPLVEQKSEAWYLMRQNLITASDFAQALGQGKFGSQADIIKKKVRPDNESSASFNNPFFKWGNMFEQVANDIYSKMHYNVKINEFGLIPHPTLSYFGASPDGISDTGIMLEIKCPYKRKIERGGEVPKQYYYQIQGQLEVCGLTECDYFECQFQLFSTLDEFYKAYGDERVKGVIIERVDGYKYSPIIMGGNGSVADVSLDEVKAWIDDNTNEEFVDIKFWYMHQHNLQRVTLDKPFVDEKLKDLKVVWDKILHYRVNPQRYDIEVLKVIDIGETTTYKSSKVNDKKANKSDGQQPSEKRSPTPITGYSFIVDPDE
jgi:putative phage-type endonuclease